MIYIFFSNSSSISANSRNWSSARATKQNWSARKTFLRGQQASGKVYLRMKKKKKKSKENKKYHGNFL